MLTYQSRHFDRMQLDNIDVNSNLPMYWPSRAFDATADRPLPEWEYRPGSTVECEGCDFLLTLTLALTLTPTLTSTLSLSLTPPLPLTLTRWPVR